MRRKEKKHNPPSLIDCQALCFNLNKVEVLVKILCGGIIKGYFWMLYVSRLIMIAYETPLVILPHLRVFYRVELHIIMEFST